MTNRTGITDPNLQTAEQLRRRVKELSALQAIAQATSSLADRQELISRLVAQVAELMNVEKCAILLYEPSTQELVCQVPVYGLTDEEARSYRILLHDDSAWALWQEAPYYISNDVPNDPLAQLLGLDELARIYRVRVTLLVPLRVGNRSLGVIQPSNKLDGSDFTDEDAQVLSIFAAQVAIVVENARLYQDVTRRFEQTQFLLRASESLSSTLDMTEVLRRIAREAAHAVGADTTGAYLPDADGERLHMAAGYHVPPDLLDAYRQNAIPIKGHPFVEQAWASRRPAFSYAPHPLYDQDALQLARYETILFVPMLVRDEVIGGIIAVWYHGHRVCADEELDLLMGLARQAGMATENARLFEETRRRADESEQMARRLALVNRISTLVNSSLDLDQILQIACTEMALAFAVEQSGVVLFDEDMQTGYVVAEYQTTPNGTARQVRIPLAGNPSMERVIATRKPLAIADAEHDPLLAAIRDVIRLRRIQSILIIPLLVQDRLVGTIALDALGTPRVFTTEEQALAETTANQIALAIENARRYRRTDEALERRVQELTALQRISQELTTLDLARIISVVLDEALRATGAPYGDAALVDQASGHFVFQQLRGYPVEAEKQLLAGPIAITKGLHGRAVATGEVILVPDVRLDPDFVRVVEDTQAELVVPIAYQGIVVGVISLESDRVDAFDEDDVRFLRALTDQAAVAIRNWQLFAETRQALSNLEIAHKAQGDLLATVRALSSPVIPIFEGIIVLPLVGGIDSDRAQRFTESLLAGIATQEAQVAIIDITGVPVVDTGVANYLLRAASAARLLGSEVVLVGIRPEVAQTVVQLGVDLAGIVTRADLQSGVEYALRSVGQQLVPVKRR
jgi:GAF domain-containing protein